MKLIDIKKIEEVLILDKPILRHKVTGLAATAQENSSLLVNVELRLKNEKNFEEKFEVVAKLLASTQNWKKIESFKNEVAFYTTIVPLLQGFLRAWGSENLDVFPKYYGGRLTMNRKVKDADKDAVFFLENLQTSGFRTLNPQQGFDFETTKLVLTELAKFHASFLAVKLRKPESFKHEIKPHINSAPDDEPTVDAKHVVSLMWENEACVSLIPRIRRAMSQTVVPFTEPLATIIHGDFWTSNIMVKSRDEIPEKIKILDFQRYTYGSPATDLIFFLFTSVQISALEDNFEILTNFYHKNFVSVLENRDCDITPFSQLEFSKELNIVGRSGQFSRIMSKWNSIFESKITPEHKERGWFIVQEFARRNWL